MKFLSIFTLLLVSLLAYTSAQRCIGMPRNPSCVGPRNTGRFCRGCTSRIMWYYDAASRQCHAMRYWGHAGNNNRWCTRAICQHRCLR